jgi:enoyl-CoA hydratase/carnithine racemase
MSAAESAEPRLIVERDGPILVMTLNRPRVRNAVDSALARAIAGALDELDADPALRVGILTGSGGTFSSGMDLAAFLRGEPRYVEGRGFAGLTEAPPSKPLIAAVEGAAVAGGCEMALACDLIIAARDARFGLPEVKRGLIAGSGGLLRLARRIPPQVALEYALTGDSLPAAEAYRLGLVSQVTDPGGALAAARELAVRICEGAPLSVRFTKELINLAAQWPGPEAWERQRELVDIVVASADAREGSQAFLEKRPPNWRGE